MWYLGDRKLPGGIVYEGGSDWACFNKDLVSYIVNGNDELIVGLKTLYSYTAMNSESFFHTLLRNSKFCSSYVNNGFHLVNWKNKGGCGCLHQDAGDFCGCSPKGKLVSLLRLLI